MVTLEYVFKPANLTFQQGVAYRLRVDNKGKETHEFTARDFFKAVELRDAKPLNADHTEIVVQPGEHKDLGKAWVDTTNRDVDPVVRRVRPPAGSIR